MGCFQLCLLAVIFALEPSAMAQVQSSVDRPKIIIDDVELEGTLLPRTAQEQLVASLKQGEWEEKSGWTADLESAVISAEDKGWPDRANQGYLGFSVSASWKPLHRERGILHVVVTIHVDEGQPKRLKKIEFRNAGGHLGAPVFDADTLRKLIPLQDGEIYARCGRYVSRTRIHRFNDHRVTVGGRR
jgi:outer membrane protein assembly factor BamA